MSQSPPVVLLAYDGIAADEAGIVTEILTSAGIRVIIASVEADPVTSYHGQVVPQRPASGIEPCGALVVCGGMGVRTASTNRRLVAAIAAIGRKATWLGSTSTGSVLLAAAGLVDGARVTTHWLAGRLITDPIRPDGSAIEVVDQPFVEYGRVLTASGVASAPQLAFRLVGALAGPPAEDEARRRFSPPPRGPRPLRGSGSAGRGWRRRPWWGRRKIVTDEHHRLDPSGAAEVIVLDLDPG